MADEVVFKLQLEGQANTPGNATGTGIRTPATPGNEADLAYRMARARLDREALSELSDQHYRAIKRGVSASDIEDEDHQAKLDKIQAQAQAKRDQEKKDAIKTDPAAAAEELLRRERFAEEIRVNAEAQRRGTSVDVERERQAEERRRDEFEKRLEEQKKADSEAAKEAKRQQDEANAKDPKFLAQQALERQKLLEQTRLELESLKTGLSPAAIKFGEDYQQQQEENQKAGVKGANRFRTGVNLASTIAGGDAFKIGTALGNLNPISGPIVSAILGLGSQLKGFTDDMRPALLNSGRFSGEVIMGNIENKMAAIRQDLQISKDKGAQIAAQEKENAFFDRAAKQQGVEIATGIGATLQREWNLFKLGITELIRDPFGNNPLGQKPAPPAPVEKPFRIPGPFKFMGDKARDQIRDAIQPPFVKPGQGNNEAQMDGM